MEENKSAYILAITLIAVIVATLSACSGSAPKEVSSRPAAADRSSAIASATNTATIDLPPKEIVITIENYAFTPADVTVSAGAKLTWINRDAVAHTATENGTKFDSGMLAQGKEYTTTLSTPGSFAYFCKPHPKMKGRITVK
ncbi:MAG: cupredoxin family copper-binding protein [Pyrinomonadaceae bacterium]